jgi:hypothetical protein
VMIPFVVNDFSTGFNNLLFGRFFHLIQVQAL